MCGLAGYVSKGASLDLGTVIRKMTDAVSHRGPDGQGTFISGGVALGHRRLAIIDLSELGHQPMTDAQNGCVIVYNGEIYNYIEIRRDLLAKGYGFTSQSDTEVILKAYSCWGEACVERFNGMWSFAIFDPSRQRLFCSRDRFGEKPFYYCDQAGYFAFGSEIRQLLPLLPEIIAEAGAVSRFLHRRVAEPLASTFFRGVKKLPGGHNLIYDLQSGSHVVSRYYELARSDAVPQLGFDDALEGFAHLLQDAVRLRLRSDVMVGTCLSGGLDSSSIASLSAPLFARADGSRFSALTAISEEPSSDESGYARMVVERSGLNWITVRPSYADFRASIDTVVRAQEEPFSSPSPVMQFFVMQLARKSGIPVLLDGQGGDEALLGYHRYYADYCVHLLRRGRIGDCLGFLQGLTRNGDRGALRQLAWNLAYFHMPAIRALAQRHSTVSFKAEFQNSTVPGEFHASPRSMFDLQKTEIEETNLPALLRLEDKNAMWHSVETRLPFLDHRLVEFALSVPEEMKLHQGWSKYLLRKSMEDLMPRDIAWRRSKLGFAAPEHKWMSGHSEAISSAICASPLIAELVAKMTPEAVNRTPAGLRWRLYSLARWADEFNTVGLR